MLYVVDISIIVYWFVLNIFYSYLVLRVGVRWELVGCIYGFVYDG